MVNFTDAIERVRHRGERAPAAHAIARRSESLTAPQPLPAAPAGHRLRIIVGERQRRLYVLEPAKIDYIESDGNYVTIRAGGTEYISRDSIKRLSGELADFGFVRIERSLLVNVNFVHFIEPLGHGTFAFTLVSGVCLRSSATYREAILDAIPLQRCRSGGRGVGV